MRCHRIGQKEMVNVRFASISDSVDQKVERVVMKKLEHTNMLNTKEYNDGN